MGAPPPPPPPHAHAHQQVAGAWDALALQGLSLEQQNAELLRCASLFLFLRECHEGLAGSAL